MDEEEDDLGPWKDENFASTAQANAGIGADAQMPEDLRFRSNIAKLVRRRLAESGGDPKTPGLFLLCPLPPKQAVSLKPKRVPMLDNGLQALSGRVWFVSEVAASGYYVNFSAENDEDFDDELFKFATDELEVGSIPAIVFDPRQKTTPSLRFYKAGLESPDQCEEIPYASVEVTLKKVTEIVEDTYNQKMITSDAQPKTGKLWQNKSKWYPREDAEDRVQMYLELALNAAFPTCVVRREQDIPEGRLDIEIVESDPLDKSIVTQHAILELKVLRSFGARGSLYTDSYTKGWIKSGVEQAAAYRDSKGAKWGALYCFDMRKDDIGKSKCFKHVSALAKKLDVHLQRWFLYATSKQLRSAKAAV